MNIPQEESDRLQMVREKLKSAIDRAHVTQSSAQKELLEKRKYLWEELVGNDRAAQDRYETASQRADIQTGEKELLSEQEHISHLKKSYQTPYFARVDFREEGESAEKFYIGKYGFTDFSTFDQLICDWRSDVASLYYEFEPGKASYPCRLGKIEGDMLLKRQFQIERGVLLGCFDTALSIEDQFLQRILSGHAGETMKTIVDSIQSHQNKIIRETESPLVAINGCAGSGKTSVALHRIAYLLYHSNRKLTASQCMIFSPNRLFEDYISSVLPELGEDNVWQSTFSDFASSILGKQYDVHTFIETVAAQEGRLLKEKGAADFGRVLDDACKQWEQKRAFFDIKMEGILLASADELKEYFSASRKTLNYLRSYRRVKNLIFDRERKNIKAIRQSIADRLKEQEKQGIMGFLSAKELNMTARLEDIHQIQSFTKQLDAEFIPDFFKLYAEVLENQFGKEERSAFERRLAEGTIYFEDATPLLYMMERLGYLSQTDRICQIVIDEAQDYSDLQYLLLLHLYPTARFTVLGDLHQSLTECGQFIDILSGYGGDRSCKVFTMDINYRSSKQIVEYTNRLMGKELCRAIQRESSPVAEAAFPSLSDSAAAINDFLNSGDSEELAAVICRNTEQCTALFRLLQREDSCLLNQESAVRNRRICILPVYLAKGLEFDRTVVVDDGNYASDSLYIACTRALHHLAVYKIAEM